MPNEILNKKVGATLVATGILSRVMAIQAFHERGFEITPEQYLVLSILDDHGELYQRQISEITYKDRPNITRIINILEEHELVKRVEDVNKRKVFKIVVTPKGRDVRAKIKPTMIELREITTQNISKEELESCLATLGKMLDNMKEKTVMQI